MDVFKERIDLTERLLKALEHLSVREQMAIVTAFMSLSDLQEITEFQERS